MDKLKDILRLMIRHRFWIVVGVSALLPALAYFLGSAPVKAKAEQATNSIKQANTDVQKYATGVVTNQQYKTLVAEKHEELAKDVLATWKRLYERQAPLLKWPANVSEQFQAWGRKWPEPEQADASVVQLAIINYLNEYPKAVTEVYKSFNPWDPATGKGIVAAPPELELLRPAQFSEDAPPALGKVWDSQERLWIQSTMLDVVAQVNKDAKDWDSAIVKQITLLEVGNPQSQDQRSMAKGDTLEEAPELVAPGAEVATEESAAVEGPMGMMGMGMGMRGMMGGGGGVQGKPESVYYLKASEGGENAQFRVVPVKMSVLLDLDHVQEFLVAFENSPMAVQIMDFEMAKPGARVTKPLQGEDYKLAMSQGGGMMGMYGGMRGPMMGSGGNRMTGFGGMASYARAMEGMEGMGGGMGSMGMMGMRGMMGGAGGATAPEGVDKRNVNRAEERKKVQEREKETKPATSIHDPYYDIVEVTIYGQARFYNPPPAEPAAESNAEAGAAADPTSPADDTATTKPESAGSDPKAADGTTPNPDAPPDDASKAAAEAPKAQAEPKAPEAKTDVPQVKADAETPRS